MKTYFSAISFVLAALLVLPPSAKVTIAAEEAYETPRPLNASKILDKSLLKGQFHSIDETVQNDGYMNTYAIVSKFGRFMVISTASLKMRIEEMKAIDAMRKLQQSDAFQGSLKKAGSETLAGVKAMASDPKKAIAGTATGIGKTFRMAGEAVRSKPGAG